MSDLCQYVHLCACREDKELKSWVEKKRKWRRGSLKYNLSLETILEEETVVEVEEGSKNGFPVAHVPTGPRGRVKVRMITRDARRGGNWFSVLQLATISMMLLFIFLVYYFI